MEIITTRRYKFRVHGQEFVTLGGGNIQAAPDWIILDPLYQSAKSLGTLREFNRNKTIAAQPVSEPKIEPASPQTEAVSDPEAEPPKPRRGRRKKVEQDIELEPNE